MKNEQQMPMAVLSDEEIGTLSLITYKKIIRRAYLNNKMISTEIDTCSLVSIVMSNDPRLNRMLRIRRKLNTCPLIQQNQRMEDVHENKLVVGIRAKPEPHTIEDDSRKDKTTANDASMNPDPSIVHTSDDPRRGGKLRCSDEKGTKINTPNVSSQCQQSSRRRNNSTYYNRIKVITIKRKQL